jgi:hypothetical protein
MVARKLDRDVRVHLHEYLRREVIKYPNTVVIDELTLQRKDGRIDVAVIDTQLRGYEIKSEADKLDRLARQTKIYSKVLDYLSVVVDDRHLNHAVKAVPDFWGVYVWMPGSGVGIIREPKLNLDVQKSSLAQLLWRDGALALLKEHNAQKGMSTQPKWRLWGKVAEACPHEAIHAAVLHQLKTHRRLENVG